MRTSTWKRLFGAGLLLGTLGCGSDEEAKVGETPDEPDIPAASLRATLARASDCDDLLTRVQNDAIAKLKLTVQRAKADLARGVMSGGGIVGARDAGTVAVPASGNASSPTRGGDVAESDGVAPPSTPSDPSKTPTTASGTNTQVAEVDEADFVKVVDSGKGIFVLQGSTLRKLKTWPASETALVGEALPIEGTPSEMFVTDAGKAVVFSSAYVQTGGKSPRDGGVCTDGCDGYGYGAALKITVADVSGAKPVVERELYFDGSYVSSRRHADGAHDVVRTVLSASSRFSGLFSPEYDAYDAWGRPYSTAVISAQIDAWQARTIDDIRNTTLDDWLPGAFEKKNGAMQAIAPACGDYFVPIAGVADYGLTRVVTLDVASPAAQVGGVTILGAASTVYASATQLVLAQPDYRWSGAWDFGVASAQQTALHTFTLSAASTEYRASGWVPGQLPLRNPQFGLDVAGDGTLRVATTGSVRDQPDAKPEEGAFWRTHTENYVLALRANGSALDVIGKTPRLGHEGESVFSARFVGDRAYVVTAVQLTDPLIAVDLKNPTAPVVLGEAQIPGFSEYVHPLDANHLITVGQGATRSLQLQLFDVTDPAHIPAPKLLPLGEGSTSEVSYQHKAFTLFEGVLAIPLSGYTQGPYYGAYRTALQLVRVDANAGFTHLGAIDHTRLYADNGAGVTCARCDANACYDFYCGYAPEVRRGVFVKGDGQTFVYSFSHAGVLVHDLANLAQPVARVGLPAPVPDPGKGYPYPVDGGVIGWDAGVGLPLDAGTAMGPADAATWNLPPVADAGVASN